MENLITEFLQLLPPLNERILLTECGEELIELSFENVRVRQRLTSVIQRGEDPKGCILGFCLDRQKNAVVHNASRQVRKVGRILGQEIIDALLKESEIQYS